MKPVKSLPLWNVLEAAPPGRDEQKLRAVRPRAAAGMIPLYRGGDEGTQVPTKVHRLIAPTYSGHGARHPHKCRGLASIFP